MRHRIVILTVSCCLLCAAFVANAGADSGGVVLGVNVHPEQALTPTGLYNVNDYTAVLDQMQAAGAKMVRVFVPWMWIEPDGPDDRAETYIAALDAYIRAVRAHGMSFVMVLVATPCWATSDPLADCVDGGYGSTDAGANYAPTDDASAGNVAAFIVKRWNPEALEVWNEPDTSDYFEPAPGENAARAYTQLTSAIFHAVKAVSPATTIVAGAIAQGDTTFLQALYGDGIASVSDAMSVHPYNIDFNNGFQYWGDPLTPFPDDAEGSFITAVPAVHQVMADNGDAAKPLWITEFGFSACNPSFACLDEETQARYLKESIQAIQGWPYVRVALVDEAWDSSSDLNDWNGFGLLRDDFTRRPAFCAFAAATGAIPDCQSDPLPPDRTAQDDLTRAWVLARQYYLDNDQSFSGFDAAALDELDASFSGYVLSTDDAAPSPSADPERVGIDVDASGKDITLCNVGSVRAYCVSDSAEASPSVTRGEAPYGVWAAQSATANGSSTGWTAASAASHLSVSASPGSVVADGQSTTTVTATLTDTSGHPVPGDAVVVTSSDAAEQIGPTLDNQNGTYAAVITSSTTPGRVTVTATDDSAIPTLSGEVTLNQTVPGALTTTQPIPTTSTPSMITSPATETSTATATTPSPPGGLPIRTLPANPARFAGDRAHIELGTPLLTVNRAGVVVVTLYDTNAFAVRLTRLVLSSSRGRLALVTSSRFLKARSPMRLAVRVSATELRRLRRRRRVAVELELTVQEPAGGNAMSRARGVLTRD